VPTFSDYSTKTLGIAEEARLQTPTGLTSPAPPRRHLGHALLIAKQIHLCTECIDCCAPAHQGSLIQQRQRQIRRPVHVTRKARQFEWREADMARRLLLSRASRSATPTSCAAARRPRLSSSEPLQRRERKVTPTPRTIPAPRPPLSCAECTREWSVPRRQPPSPPPATARHRYRHRRRRSRRSHLRRPRRQSFRTRTMSSQGSG
jgi:hypothetical protein